MKAHRLKIEISQEQPCLHRSTHFTPLTHLAKTFLSHFFMRALGNDVIPFNFSARVSINNLFSSV